MGFFKKDKEFMKVLVIHSDKGLESKVLKEAMKIEKNADYYIHLGDTDLNPEEIKEKFHVFVPGTKDIQLRKLWDDYQVVTLGGLTIVVSHFQANWKKYAKTYPKFIEGLLKDTSAAYVLTAKGEKLNNVIVCPPLKEGYTILMVNQETKEVTIEIR